MVEVEGSGLRLTVSPTFHAAADAVRGEQVLGFRFRFFRVEA